MFCCAKYEQYEISHIKHFIDLILGRYLEKIIMPDKKCQDLLPGRAVALEFSRRCPALPGL